MSNAEIYMHLIYHVIGIVLGICLGWILHSNKNLRSTSNSGICDQLTDNLEEDKRRIESNQTELGECIEAGERIKDILRQYSDTTNQEQKSE